MPPPSGDAHAPDEVVATVADADEARPLIESLLLAGLGPSLRDGPTGTEITVVTGQGGRARQVLGLPGAASEPPGGARSKPGPGGVRSPGGEGPGIAPTSALDAIRRSSTVRALVIFAIALVVIPTVAFFVSYKLAGG